jgi:cell division protein FtsN
VSRVAASRGGRTSSVLLGIGFCSVVGLVFLFGMAAGRHWPGLLPSIGASARAEREAAARREAERRRTEPPALTFYQELTAPLAPASPAPRSGAARPPRAAGADPAGAETRRPERGAPAASPVAAGGRPAEAVLVEPARGAGADDPPAPAAAARVPAGSEGGRFTVQVGAFSAREPADALRARLAAAGHDAYITEADGGSRARYRVRVGSFATREQARQTAERLGRERVSTYVTARW